MADVLRLKLSSYHSLDLVRLPKSRRYRIVFAERQGVQRRAFVEISFEDAAKIAAFLATGEAVPQVIEPDRAAEHETMRDEVLKKEP